MVKDLSELLKGSGAHGSKTFLLKAGVTVQVP